METIPDMNHDGCWQRCLKYPLDKIGSGDETIRHSCYLLDWWSQEIRFDPPV